MNLEANKVDDTFFENYIRYSYQVKEYDNVVFEFAKVYFKTVVDLGSCVHLSFTLWLAALSNTFLSFAVMHKILLTWLMNFVILSNFSKLA